MLAVVAVALAYTPLAPWFGFVPLPLPVLAGLVAITVLYVVASEFTKRWLYDKGSRPITLPKA
ncbi:hypothetical protein C7I87_32850 [Mesorhizobium sp. SARCC-RB16n]|uniref:hypothetical protein n=1 Tax=Mesorhizobium sp. SARCC-RB16n TaxID=2116687 RepID=UPI00122F3605|nr:hypothetical protein [Mesorhizobium sp. SARCC-RB16n]KAA3441983.1 hypothetical protein C7I87_32850 [Mesorhizobium sp. SARCC-RB16n]